jgi:ribonuclease G
LLLQNDPARTSVFYFTRLGLIQITRKRTTESNISFMTEPCPYCNGNGIILSRDTVVFKIFRDIQRQVRLHRSRKLIIKVHPDAALALETTHFEKFQELQKELKVSVEIDKSVSFHREHYHVSSEDGN